MGAGAKLKKWTWLMDDVVVTGIVRFGGLPNGSDVGTSDAFDLELDPNHRHMIASNRGNNPLPGGPSGCIHVEAYSQSFDSAAVINRTRPVRPDKPRDKIHEVFDPAIGARRPLRVGDRVRLTGLWIVENQHEDICWTRVRGFQLLGRWLALKIGCVWMELHPFHWENIQLITPAVPTDTETETLSLAAPVYEETYQRGGAYPQTGRVFVAEDGSNFHNAMSAELHVKAPSLPAGFTPHASLVRHTEQILLNGTSLPASQVRTISLMDDGIGVKAVVSAPVKQYVDGVGIADIHDPAGNRSVFKARYTVGWLPRVVATDNLSNPIQKLELGSQIAGSTTSFVLYLQNRGPDPLTIASAEVNSRQATAFRFQDASGTVVPAWSTVQLHGTFAPPRWLGGRFPVQPPFDLSGVVVVRSDDPAQPRLELPIEGTALPRPPTAEIEVSPRVLDFGRVRVGTHASLSVTARNTGSADAYVSTITRTAEAPAGQFHPPAVFRTDAIPPGQTREISLSFSPTVRGPAAATFRLDGSFTFVREPTVAVEGRGVAPVIRIHPATLDFGAIAPATSKTLPLEIRNEGDDPLQVTGMSMLVSGRSFFLNPAVTFPIAIQAGGATSVDITYTADAVAGQRADDEFEIASDDPWQPRLRFSLTGIAAGPRIEWPDIIDFGEVTHLPAVATAFIGNAGSSELTVQSTRLETGARFALVGLPATPFAVAAGQRQQFQVLFDAAQPGTHVDYLRVDSDDASRPHLSVTVKAIQP